MNKAKNELSKKVSRNDLSKINELPQKDSMTTKPTWKQRIQETGEVFMCSPLLLEAEGSNGGLVPLVICCVLTFYLFGVTGSKKTK